MHDIAFRTSFSFFRCIPETQLGTRGGYICALCSIEEATVETRLMVLWSPAGISSLGCNAMGKWRRRNSRGYEEVWTPWKKNIRRINPADNAARHPQNQANRSTSILLLDTDKQGLTWKTVLIHPSSPILVHYLPYLLRADWMTKISETLLVQIKAPWV